jgi:hypothetical protein
MAVLFAALGSGVDFYPTNWIKCKAILLMGMWGNAPPPVCRRFSSSASAISA